jgi:hypothetical protein
MTAVCAVVAHGPPALRAFWSAEGAGLMVAVILVAFFVLAYFLINSEKAFPFIKLSRSGFEIGFKPFKKQKIDDAADESS